MYKAIVIGAGSIGALKDDKYDSPASENVLTHAHAYKVHQWRDLFLVGIIDIEKQKAEQAGNKWQCKFSTAINNFGEDKIDFVSICTPTNTHKKVILEVIEKIKPVVIIAEKPFCNNSAEAKEVIDVASKAKIPIVVNYSRRYVWSIKHLFTSDNSKSYYTSAYYNKIFNAAFYYSRGLKHEMSHGIDLCRFLFGEYKGGHIEQPGYGIFDRDKEDPTVAAYLSFEKCPHVFFFPCDGRQYKVFQLEMMTDKGKLILSQHGLYMDQYPIIQESIYGDFKILSKDIGSRIPTNLNHSLETLTDLLMSRYDNKDPMRSYSERYYWCTAQDALEVHKIIEHLKGE